MKKIVSSSGCSISRRSTFAPQLMRTKWRNYRTTGSQLVWGYLSPAAPSRGHDIFCHFIKGIWLYLLFVFKESRGKFLPACNRHQRVLHLVTMEQGLEVGTEKKNTFLLLFLSGAAPFIQPVLWNHFNKSPLWSPGCPFQPQHPYIYFRSPVDHLGHPTSPPAHQHKGCGSRWVALIQSGIYPTYQSQIKSNQNEGNVGLKSMVLL